MSRTEIGGSFSLAGCQGSIHSANVSDYQGASVIRRSLNYKNNKLSLKVNYQDIDSAFSRINDLSDKDRNLLVQERGFRRMDYAINFQAAKNLNIDTYIYDSTNTNAGQTRGQDRWIITYNPNKGPKITAYLDDYSYVSELGNLSSYSRRKLLFDNSLSLYGGITIKALSDINTTQEGNSNPITTTIQQTHIESNQALRLHLPLIL